MLCHELLLSMAVMPNCLAMFVAERLVAAADTQHALYKCDVVSTFIEFFQMSNVK